MRYDIHFLTIVLGALLLTMWHPVAELVVEHGVWEWIQVLALVQSLMGGILRAHRLSTVSWPLRILVLGIIIAIGEEVQWGASLVAELDSTTFGIHEQQIGDVDLNVAAGWILQGFTAVFLIILPIAALWLPGMRRWIRSHGWPIPSWRLVPFAGFAMVMPMADWYSVGWSGSEVQETLVYLVLCIALWSPEKDVEEVSYIISR
ncbi:hypothetical protein SCG7086_BV_00020 [Chlamydiales bacterium SCGC AG-110-P3]|nr:hypothetical protein SCG7086_BV_00020 [Chlamydiales bacterium SCGC AG-110-P3]